LPKCVTWLFQFPVESTWRRPMTHDPVRVTGTRILCQ